MKPFANRNVNTKLNIISALLLLALFAALAFNGYRREQSLILKGAIDNARIVSRLIIESRDYLSKNVTTEPEHNANLIPQVAATRIAQQITRGSKYYVRQVSLRYRNPSNSPDAFESAQLQRFQTQKSGESYQIARAKGKESLRYLLPMVAGESCLTCHGAFETAPHFIQARFPKGHLSYGYKMDEVIGAISVSVPVEEFYGEISTNLRRSLVYDGIVLVLFLSITGWIIRRTILNPVKMVATQIADVARTGNYSARLDQRSNDEIGELVGSYNELMAELDRRTLQRMESEDRYRNFIEIAQSPIVTFMGDGKIVITNHKAEKLFGLTKQELLGQSIFDFLEKGEEIKTSVEAYFTAGNGDLIGTTSRQRVRDVCGRFFVVDMVISVSQSDQSPMFSAILRAVT